MNFSTCHASIAVMACAKIGSNVLEFGAKQDGIIFKVDIKCVGKIIGTMWLCFEGGIWGPSAKPRCMAVVSSATTLSSVKSNLHWSLCKLMSRNYHEFAKSNYIGMGWFATMCCWYQLLLSMKPRPFKNKWLWKNNSLVFKVGNQLIVVYITYLLQGIFYDNIINFLTLSNN